MANEQIEEYTLEEILNIPKLNGANLSSKKIVEKLEKSHKIRLKIIMKKLLTIVKKGS